MRYYEFFIGLRFTLAGKHDRFVSFVSALSMLGIALGVAALLTVLAVMTGFQNQLRERILGIASHLEVAATDGELRDWHATAEMYLQNPAVIAAAPNIQEQGLLVNGEHVRGVLMHGIEPPREAKVNTVVQNLEAEFSSALAPGSFRIYLGDVLARNLRVSPGDKVMLLAPKGKLTAAGLLPRIRRVEVAGVFDSGVHQFDSSLAYMHLQDAQRIYRLGDSVSSVRLKLDDIIRAPALRAELQEQSPPNLFLYDWTSSHGELFRALALEKRAMFVILTLIITVAAFNIVSALVTMVRNKRGEIAILRAMGVGGGGITRIFLLQGMLIGGGGVILGLAAGLPLAANVGEIVAWIEGKFDYALFPGNIYQLGKLPSDIVLSDVLSVAAIALLISLAAAAVPAWRGGRLSPAESLRHE